MLVRDTASRRSESADVAEYQRLSAENAADVIWVADLDLRLLYVSPSIEKMTGYSVEETLSGLVHAHLTPNSLQEVRELNQKIVALEKGGDLKADQSWTMEVEYVRKDGSKTWIEIKSRLLRTPDGKLKGFLGINRDISDRKRVEDLLRLHLENYTRLLENIHSGIALVNYQGIFLYLNTPAAKALGKRVDEIVGKTQWDIFPKEIADAQMVTIRKVIEARKEYRGDAKTWVNNEWRWYNTILQPFKNAEDQEYVALVIIHDITERKRAEQEWAQSHDVLQQHITDKSLELNRELEERKRVEAQLELLNMAVEQSTEGIMVSNMDGYIVYVNNHLAMLHGYTKEELIGKHLSIFHTAEQMESVRIAAERTLKSDQFSGELWQVRKDGSVFPGYVHGTIFRDEKGAPLGVLGTLSDITNRKLAELALKSSEERYRLLVETSPDAILTTNLDGKILSINVQMATMFGFNGTNDPAIIGQSALNIINPEDRPEVRKRKPEVMQLLQVKNLQFRAQRKDGSNFYVEINAALFEDANEKPLGFIGILRDITERKGAEEALKSSEEQYRKLVETMREGLLLNDENAHMTFVNQRFCEMVGYPREELIGASFGILVSQEDIPEGRSQIEKRRLGIETPYEITLRHKNGEKIIVSISPKALFDNDGNYRGSFGVVTDITERKRVEDELNLYREKLEHLVSERTTRILQLEREKIETEKLAAAGRMAAQVAHEINNPLAGIKSAFGLVAGGVPADYPYYHYISNINKEIDRIGKIVERMYRLYRVDEEAATEFVLDSVIAEILDLIKQEPRCIERKIRLKALSKAAGLKIKVPENLLRQILFNLLKNAVEASPQQGIVELCTRAQHGRIVITCRDQGSGIPEEIRGKIFEPFFTTKSSLPSPGLGMGLSITKSLVEVMRGTIAFSSEVNQGTTFRIEIPLPN